VDGLVETNVTGFVIPIPFSNSISEVEIQHNNIVFTEINPFSGLLHNAIGLMPDHGFIKKLEQRRNTLHNKISEIEVKIEEDDLIGTISKLDHDIKDKLEKWLVNDYQINDPLQFLKGEILDLINEIIDRLELQL